ncbi:MAG: D-amino acid dehydrogenase [Curvibacter sp.]
MKIAVIGAGIIGVTTAWELARDGHEVTVIERRIAVAEEGSFANTGLIAPGYSSPWATPGMSLRILRHLFSRHSPVRHSLPLTGNDLAWIWKSWRACAAETSLRNRQALQGLAHYSRSRLHTLGDELELEFDRSQGLLVLLRSEREQAQLRPALQLLKDQGLPHRELSPEQARAIEPALNPDTAFHGALHLPDDEAGNCRQFALLLKNAALARGVQFAFSTDVERLTPGTGGLDVHIAGENLPRRYDAAVLCAGMDSARLLRGLGIKLPLAAVYGYSVSASVREPLNAPRSAVLDERYKVAITRLGQRVRVGGGAELGGRAERQNKAALLTLYKVLQDWFPGAAVHSSGVQTWKGTRAMLPDGPPVLGASGIPGLWLNCGHGSSGWTLGCGAARALADLVAGRTPDTDLAGFGLARLQG